MRQMPDMFDFAIETNCMTIMVFVQSIWVAAEGTRVFAPSVTKASLEETSSPAAPRGRPVHAS